MSHLILLEEVSVKVDRVSPRKQLYRFLDLLNRPARVEQIRTLSVVQAQLACCERRDMDQLVTVVISGVLAGFPIHLPLELVEPDGLVERAACQKRSMPSKAHGGLTR